MNTKTLAQSIIILALMTTLNLWLIGLPNQAGAEPLNVSGAVTTHPPIGTGFTYQGNLAKNDGPAGGEYDFRFTLFDSEVGGTQVGDIVEVDNVTVTEGLFGVELDFGANVFTGAARYLEIGVQAVGGSGYTVLTPRQVINPAPYALYAHSAGSVPWSGLTEVPADFSDNTDDDTLNDLTCAANQIAKWNGSSWICAEDNDQTLSVETFTAWLTNSDDFTNSTSLTPINLEYTDIKQNTDAAVFEMQLDGSLKILKSGTVSLTANFDAISPLYAEIQIYINDDLKTLSLGNSAGGSQWTQVIGNLSWTVNSNDVITLKSRSDRINHMDNGPWSTLTMQWIGMK